MLFTDEDLFGPLAHQIDLFEVLAEVERERMAESYGDEPGVIDLFGVGQLSLAGI